MSKPEWVRKCLALALELQSAPESEREIIKDALQDNGAPDDVLQNETAATLIGYICEPRVDSIQAYKVKQVTRIVQSLLTDKTAKVRQVTAPVSETKERIAHEIHFKNCHAEVRGNVDVPPELSSHERFMIVQRRQDKNAAEFAVRVADAIKKECNVRCSVVCNIVFGLSVRIAKFPNDPAKLRHFYRCFFHHAST